MIGAPADYHPVKRFIFPFQAMMVFVCPKNILLHSICSCRYTANCFCVHVRVLRVFGVGSFGISKERVYTKYTL